MDAKQRAAEAALDELKDGMIVGLGTGSTANYFLDALGEALASKKLRDIKGVPTSLASEGRARELKIPLIALDASTKIDVTVDGADEVAPNRDLIKGLGGALLREKIVAQNSKRLVIIADSSKLVSVLGVRSPLPVEVAQFAGNCHEAFFKTLGAAPKLRMTKDESPFVTDNGNFVYDCKFHSIDIPSILEVALMKRAGIIECGLFVGLAQTVIVGYEDRVERI